MGGEGLSGWVAVRAIDDHSKNLNLSTLTDPFGQSSDQTLFPGPALGDPRLLPVRAAPLSRDRDALPQRTTRMRSLSFAWLLALPVLTAGCTVGPSWTRPTSWSPTHWFDAHKPVPATLPESVPVAEKIDPNWWTLFHDSELTSLENRVADANLNVRISTIRLAESRSQRQITGADQFPTVSGSGSYTRERVSSKGVLGVLGGGGGGSSFASMGSSANGTGGRSGGIPSSATGGATVPPFNLFQYGFDASWELDLWGRVRREVESADASLDASADARRNSLLSVLAEVARDYMQLRGVQTQLAIANDNIKVARQSLDLTQARYKGGLTTDLDVANAAAQLASNQADVPQLEQSQDEQINALSFLLGEAPQALRAELIAPGMVPPVPPRVPVGVPSELARRRPDIREAEAQLHAATADIGVAVADFYPKITLDGSIGLQALKAKDLGNWGARQYGLGPTISIPIFEGGKLRATLQLRKVEQQEAALNYQQTVLQAWHDVDNALTAYAAEQRRRDALSNSVAQNRRALDLSRQRYTQGVADFLNVLDAQRTLLQAELQLAESTTTVSQNLVQLYKALGGGWETRFPVADGRRGTI
jgi:NodT family efflux transporter outer membrane factor (OMF) lipoprotein